MATGIPCGQPSLQGCVKYDAIYDGLCPGSHAATDPSSIAAIGQEPTRASCILPAGPPIASRPIHVRGFALAPRLGQRRTTKKKPRNISVPGLCMRLGIKLTLAELGSATGSLEAVLKFSDCRFSLIFQGFPGLPLKIAPPFNQKNGGILVSGR